MKADGLLDPAVKTSFTAVLWLGDDPERMKVLRELREAMPPGQRSRLNSPITARQRVEAILQARRHGVEESVKTSPVALLKEAMVEQAREIVELKQKLAKHEQGSLFDLKHDSADDIASAITGNLSAHKARVWPTASSAAEEVAEAGGVSEVRIQEANGLPSWKMVPELQLGIIAITFYHSKKFQFGLNKDLSNLVCPWRSSSRSSNP